MQHLQQLSHHNFARSSTLLACANLHHDSQPHHPFLGLNRATPMPTIQQPLLPCHSLGFQPTSPKLARGSNKKKETFFLSFWSNKDDDNRLFTRQSNKKMGGGGTICSNFFLFLVWKKIALQVYLIPYVRQNQSSKSNAVEEPIWANLLNQGLIYLLLFSSCSPVGTSTPPLIIFHLKPFYLCETFNSVTQKLQCFTS